MKPSLFYYETQFPAEVVFSFFTAHTHTRPERREFATTYLTTEGEMWARYKSVYSAKQLRELTLKPRFSTLHVGPIFKDQSSFRSIKSSTPIGILGQFLVFDLDLETALFGLDGAPQTEVDRFTRQTFAKVGVLIAILRAVFGFSSFLPVYSGRRGVHLYVLDSHSRSGLDIWKYDNETRRAICDLINKRSKKDSRIVSSKAIVDNPTFDDPLIVESFDKACEVLLTPFSDGGVGLLDREADVRRFLFLLFDEISLFPSYREQFSGYVQGVVFSKFKRFDSKQTLQDIKNAISDKYKIECRHKLTHNTYYLDRVDDILFAMIFPELDTNVTSQVIHCIKAPFSLHGKTNRIAIPVGTGSLFGNKHNTLPPVVTPGDKSEESTRLFHLAIANMQSATANLSLSKKPSNKRCSAVAELE